MRLIILVVILAVIAFALGWWYVRDTSETWEIIIDKDEAATDVEEAVEKGRQWLDEAAGEADEPDAPDTGNRLEPAGTTEPPHTPQPEPQGANP